MSRAPTNPPTRDILTNHELASRTISQHNTELAIFDQERLAILKRFALDPSPETQRSILEDADAVDPDDTPEDRIGRVAAEKGDLAAMVVARYGKVTDSYHTFHPSEVDALREWFQNGGGQ